MASASPTAFAGRVFVLCILLASMSPTPASARRVRWKRPKGQRIFYTGHSFHMFVVSYIESFAKTGRIRTHQLVGKQSIGGSNVWQHWDLPDGDNQAKQALRTGEVDVFTMAVNVSMPDRGVDSFVELGLRHNPEMRFLVQLSWCPFDYLDRGERVKDNSDRDDGKIRTLRKDADAWRKQLEEQVARLNRNRQEPAVFIVPVGDAVLTLRELVVAGEYPGVTKQSDLFVDRIGHGGPHVRALASYCNLAAIYKTNPQGLEQELPNITEEQNAILKRVAWETVSSYQYAGIAPSKRR